MKIALISDDFPPASIGGIASYCYDLAHSLSKAKVNTTVFCGRSRDMRIEKINSFLTIVHLPYVYFPPKFLWFQLMNFRSLLKCLKGFDILHAVSPYGFGLLSRFRGILGGRLVTTIHGAAMSDLRAFVNSPPREWTMGDFMTHVVAYPLSEALTRSSLTYSDHIFICGSSTQRDIEESSHLDQRRVSVIRNGIDFAKLRSFSVDVDRDPDLVLYYGRLVWRKGILYLIKAIGLLTQQFPNVKLEICGTGPLREKALRLISDLNLKDKILMRGFIPYGELITEINRASLVALPSLYEAQPISVLEAMALRRPVVAFDYPFAREYLMNSYNGFLATPEDAQDLAEKIGLLISNPKLIADFGQNAFEYVRENHNWDNLIEDYLQVYERLA